jgi:hypothetical protein
LGNFEYRHHRRISAAAFELAQITLIKSGLFGKLLLRQAAFKPKPFHIPTNEPPHIHEAPLTVREG